MPAQPRVKVYGATQTPPTQVPVQQAFGTPPTVQMFAGGQQTPPPEAHNCPTGQQIRLPGQYTCRGGQMSPPQSGHLVASQGYVQVESLMWAGPPGQSRQAALQA